MNEVKRIFEMRRERAAKEKSEKERRNAEQIAASVKDVLEGKGKGGKGVKDVKQ